ncbi:MAG TPA: hypothetical protein VFL57_08120 [Bryobacteraceae bacterium]|nr:hypothetical protein [Bryobacteraceae bacterium]
MRLFRDRLKGMLGGEPSAGAPPGTGAASAKAPAVKGTPLTRHSSGLEQFFFTIRDRPGLSLIDFAGASQANISFITNLGHRLTSDDYVQSLELAFGGGDFYANQADEQRAAAFLADNLTYEDGQFDGALVWDSLQFLGPGLLASTVASLHRVLRPGSSLLAFFHADEKTEIVPTWHYRIADAKTLTLVPRGMLRRAQFFNNRALEKLFQNFASVKFFLSRDSLREVIIRR